MASVSDWEVEPVNSARQCGHRRMANEEYWKADFHRGFSFRGG